MAESSDIPFLRSKKQKHHFFQVLLKSKNEYLVLLPLPKEVKPYLLPRLVQWRIHSKYQVYKISPEVTVTMLGSALNWGKTIIFKYCILIHENNLALLFQLSVLGEF